MKFNSLKIFIPICLLVQSIFGQVNSPYLKNITTEDGLVSNTVHVIYQDNLGYIWFGTDNGVSRFDGYEFVNFSIESGLLDFDIIAIKEDDQGRVLLLSSEDNIFSYYKGEMTQFESSLTVSNMFSVNTNTGSADNSLNATEEVVSSISDYEGSYWFSTVNNDGVYYLPIYPNVEVNLLLVNKIRGLTLFNDELIVGEENECYFLDKKEKFTTSNTEIKEPVFIEDKLYLNSKFIYSHNGKLVNPSISSNDVLIVDEKLYVISDNKVIEVHPKNKKATQLSVSPTTGIHALGLNLNNEVLLATDNGLYHLDNSNRFVKKEIASEFLNREIIAIGYNKSTSLVALTKRYGLVFEKDGTIQTLKIDDKLKPNQIKDFYIDKNNHIWLKTIIGLYQINERLQFVRKYTTKNGLLANNILDVEILGERAYVVTENGLNSIDYNNFDNDTIPLKIHIPYIRLDNDKVEFPKRNIEIDPQYSYLTISFTGINYKASSDIHYQYKINGIHDEWIDAKEKKVQFTSLPPSGDYVFEVKAHNGDGVWSEPYRLNMTFLSPFYKTAWFIIGMTLLSILIVWFIVRTLYKRKVKTQKLRADLLQLEGKALQSQMNPHFVFNALNSIQSFIATGDTFNSEIYLAKFSELLRKTLNNSRENTIELSKEIEVLKMYLELEKMRFGDRLDYEISVDNDVETDLVKIPPMLIQPFIENAILHGISPKQGGGKVSLTIKNENLESIQCIILDDGVGRSEAKNNGHVSLGTKIVQKRLSILGG
ncbi:MAG: histidine kinase, partial [Flavobacteriaceae bacterium]|nr:histidine kinase [Flavobacteriaceae bacterium]